MHLICPHSLAHVEGGKVLGGVHKHKREFINSTFMVIVPDLTVHMYRWVEGPTADQWTSSFQNHLEQYFLGQD